MGGTLDPGVGTDGETSANRISMNPEKTNRRSIYLPLRRSNLPTLYTLFDFGDATTPEGKRSSTTVATQALFVMNSPMVMREAKIAGGGRSEAAKSWIRGAWSRSTCACWIAGRMRDEIDGGLIYMQGLRRKWNEIR